MALSLQDHPAFEVVLVADGDSVGLRPDLGLRRVVFDVPNIARARNAGVMAATGEVLAFVDDDAEPDPAWLSSLTAPFVTPDVVAATGFTRGADGVRWQARAARIDANGLPRPLGLPVPGPEPVLVAPDAVGPVAVLGTNCAYRRAALARIGGFDPVFAYHLDESDADRRLAAAFPHGRCAIVPQALVTHGLADQPGRRRAGITRDLTQVGRSIAHFCLRHGGRPAVAAATQDRRLLRAMVMGALTPGAVAAARRSLEAGLAQGAAMAALSPPPSRSLPDAPCARVTLAGTGPRPAHVLDGWLWQAAALRRQAAQAVAAGRLVTVLLFTPGAIPHRVRLTRGGWWERHGGLWGRAAPGDPMLRGGWPATVRARETAAAMQRMGNQAHDCSAL